MKRIFLLGLHRDNVAVAQLLREEDPTVDIGVLVAPGEARPGSYAAKLFVAGYYDVLQEIHPSRFLVITATNPLRRFALAQRVPTAKGWQFISVAPAIARHATAIGVGTIVHHYAHIAGVTLGAQCTVGKQAHIEAGVLVGDFSSIHSEVFIDAGVQIGVGVRIGHRSVLKAGVRVGAWADIQPETVVDCDVAGGTSYGT